MKKSLFVVVFVYVFNVFGVSKGIVIQFNTSYINQNGQYSMPLITKGLGVYFGIPIKENVSLVNEIVFNEYGALYKDYLYDIEYNTKFRLKYLEIPVLLSINLFRDLKRINLSLIGGPVISLNNSKYISRKIGSLEQKIKLDDYDEANFAMAFGLGINFTTFQIDVRYTHGVLPIYSVDNYSVKTAVFSIITKISL